VELQLYDIPAIPDESSQHGSISWLRGIGCFLLHSSPVPLVLCGISRLLTTLSKSKLKAIGHALLHTGLLSIIGTATIRKNFHIKKYTEKKTAHCILASKDTTPFIERDQ